MKLCELKKRFQNKYVIRVAAGVLTIALLGGGLGVYSQKAQAEEEKNPQETQVLADEAQEDEEEILKKTLSRQVSSGTITAGKEETVYVVAGANGKTKEVIVSEWLKNPQGKDTLEDASDLKDIENVKGNETFSQKEDGTLTWQAHGADIYYQGTTEKELPVDLTVSYRLDGKEISPEDLAGKSGKVSIRMDYTNKEQVQADVNGKKENISVPFTAISGMMLSDHFSNVEVTNGKVISDGKNQIVIGVAMPGLADSLKTEDTDLDTDLEIPSYVEVTADVEDFSLGMTMTMLMSDVLSDLDLEESLDLSELSEAIDTLSDASGQLRDGSGELKEGTGTLADKSQDLNAGAAQLAQGITAYTDGVSQVAGGVRTLQEKSGALGSGATELHNGIDTIADSFTSQQGLLDGSDSLKEGATQVSQGADALYAGVQGLTQSLSVPLSQEQKGAMQQQARDAVDDTFANGGAAEIKKQFTDNEQVRQLTAALVEAQYQQKAAEIYSQLPAIDPALKTAVDNAVNGGASLTDAIESVVWPYVKSGYNNMPTLRAAVEAGVASQMDTLLDGIVGACRESAQQAAEQAVVSGAEGAKGQIAAQLDQAKLTENVGALADGAKQVSDGAGRLSTGVHTLYEDGIRPMQSGIQGLSGSVPTLLDGINTLSNGSSTLAKNSGQLNSGATALKKGTDALIDGVKELDEGAETLKEGMEEFDQDGIQKLTDTYHGEIQSLMDRICAVTEAGKAYQTFTKLPQDMDGTVKFIIRTEGVE